MYGFIPSHITQVFSDDLPWHLAAKKRSYDTLLIFVNTFFVEISRLRRYSSRAIRYSATLPPSVRSSAMDLLSLLVPVSAWVGLRNPNKVACSGATCNEKLQWTDGTEFR